MRKCNTTKYRRRMKKQRQNRALRRETATPVEQEAMLSKIYPPAPAVILCPICNKPFTLADGEGNMHTMVVNKREVTVHRTCPEEVS